MIGAIFPPDTDPGPVPNPGCIEAVDGTLGSKKPAEFECFLVCVLKDSPACLGGNVSGDAVLTDSAALVSAVVGLEKFCRELALEFC